RREPDVVAPRPRVQPEHGDARRGVERGREMRSRVLAVGAALLLAAPLLLAGPRAARADIIRGVVRDGQGNPVYFADFNVYDAETGTKQLASDKTDHSGAYRLLVPPGRYDLLVRPVTGQGLAAKIVHDVPVDGALDLDWTLPVGVEVLGIVTDGS